ncbi:hypothetical protein HYU90_01800 [Candidatus Collierbacteria bacterium]|nr:hypothetical protein [Candidatus Collierbacteria bacterium]
MNTSGASKVLPIILTAITLATAVFFYKQRQVLRQKTQELLSQSTKPTLTPTLTPTISPTVIPTTSTPLSVNSVEESDTEQNKTNFQTPKTIASAKTTTVTVCTPVYGMANTCAEHAVVDTALDTSIFYNLAGLSYFTGLAAFIRAKKRA